MSNPNDTTGFNVLDMAQEMADASGVDLPTFFSRPASPPPPTVLPVEKPPEEEPATTEASTEGHKRKPWTPSAEVMADLPELQSQGVSYSKEEMEKFEESEGLKNIADDNAKQSARDAMDELTRKMDAIETAKARHGILHFQIPEGPWQVKVHNAAIDVNWKQAQMNLDEVFNEIKAKHPEFILDYLPGFGPEPDVASSELQQGLQQSAAGDMIEPPQGGVSPVMDGNTSMEQPEKPDVTVVIDKTNVSQVAWSKEEVEKLRKARTVELNIVESGTLEFGDIEDVETNVVDKVLSQYERKTNDVDAALPASRYRATFTGLSYPEVMDLSNSNSMNNLDGERMKWTIAFRHIKNQSIGPWKEWRYYMDPETKKFIKFNITGPLPVGVTEDMVSTHTKFDDFMEKTSYLDLEYILWKILCATAMDKELISIDCHAEHNGKECGKNYDWIYSPNELLMLSSVSPVVLEEMKVTGTVSTMEEIIKNFKSSPVNAQNTVKLPHAGYQLMFGHVNGKDYLNGIYTEIKKYDELDETDPTFISRGLNASALTVVKGFLLPKPDGSGWYRITGIQNILEILDTLDEVDWQVINQVCRMMEEPYTFSFALRDIVCPECGNRSSIPINDMSRLLFIVARSLSSVQVELKRT